MWRRSVSVDRQMQLRLCQFVGLTNWDGCLFKPAAHAFEGCMGLRPTVDSRRLNHGHAGKVKPSQPKEEVSRIAFSRDPVLFRCGEREDVARQRTPDCSLHESVEKDVINIFAPVNIEPAFSKELHYSVDDNTLGNSSRRW